MLDGSQILIPSCKRAGDANTLQTDPILSKRFNNFFCDGPIKLAPCIYLSMKQGSLLCFVCHTKIFQTTAHFMSRSWYVQKAPHE
jgi:hypothetical protein